MKKILLLVASVMVSLAAFASDIPKYVFYFIGDGLGMQPLMTAQAYNRDILKNEKPLLMFQFPVASWAMTYSASSPITDSAAAGTALSAGFKTGNGMLGVTPDTVPVTSVARQLKDMGYGVGIITSVYADDATPGAYYAHVASRKMYYDIDVYAAKSGYDFIGGAGLKGLVDSNGNPTDIPVIMKQNGVQIVRGPEGISEINSQKVVLLSREGMPDYNIGYTIDSIPGALTLPLITETCLNHLEKQSPDRFFMMVEGGNIDHALHANDAGSAIIEILNFNDALKIAYDFYLQHPDETLILVSADHDTGGMSHVKDGLGIYRYVKISKEEFSNYCKGILRSRMVYTWNDMKQYLTDNFGMFTHIEVSKEKEEALKAKFDETFEQRNSADQETLYASFNGFAVAVFDIINNAAGTLFTTTGHSGNPVPVFAVGVGSDKFKGVNNNTDLPKILREILEIAD